MMSKYIKMLDRRNFFIIYCYLLCYLINLKSYIILSLIKILKYQVKYLFACAHIALDSKDIDCWKNNLPFESERKI